MEFDVIAVMLLESIASSCIQALPEQIRAKFDRTLTGTQLNNLFHSSLFSPEVSYSSNSDPLTPFQFGEAYERFLSDSHQQTEGIFYTPEDFVSRLVKRVIDPSKHRTVLDPACGGGAFLIEAFHQLKGCKKTILEDRIFGVDRDPTAVEITKLALLTAYCKDCTELTLPDLSRNIRCGDALLAPSDSPNGFDWHKEFPQVFTNHGFDLIVGNPPYGLSRDRQMKEKENEILKRVYAKFRRGKANKYLLFMARSLSLLHSSGILSFVVPNAWLGISGGEAIREILLDEQSLREVIVHDYPVFADPNVEVVTFIVDREKRSGTVSVHRELEPGKFTGGFSIPHNLCKKNPGSTIPTTWRESTPRFLEQIDRECLPLSEFSDLFRPMIALQAYAEGKGVPPQSAKDVQNHPFDRDFKDGESCYPYLHGSDIKRFEINWSGSYLLHGPWLAEPQSIERFRGPRIVIREVLSRPPHRIQAAYLTETMLYNKSVLHILLGPKGTPEVLLALLELLNSEQMSTYITYRGRKSQRGIFPKLVLDDLLDLPIPRAFFNNATRHIPSDSPSNSQGF